MDLKENLEKEIIHQRKLIKEYEDAMDQVPDYLKSYQEIALLLQRERLEVLEKELANNIGKSS